MSCYIIIDKVRQSQYPARFANVDLIAIGAQSAVDYASIRVFLELNYSYNMLFCNLVQPICTVSKLPVDNITFFLFTKS